MYYMALFTPFPKIPQRLSPKNRKIESWLAKWVLRKQHHLDSMKSQKEISIFIPNFHMDISTLQNLNVGSDFARSFSCYPQLIAKFYSPRALQRPIKGWKERKNRKKKKSCWQRERETRERERAWRERREETRRPLFSLGDTSEHSHTEPFA